MGASVPASVLIVLGSTQGSGNDAALAKWEALRKAPFDSFPKKSLLKRVDVQLSPGKEVEVELPNGRKLRLSLLERAPGGRFRVSVSINRPGKQDYLPVMTVVAAAGDPFFDVLDERAHEGLLRQLETGFDRRQPAFDAGVVHAAADRQPGRGRAGIIPPFPSFR